MQNIACVWKKKPNLVLPVVSVSIVEDSRFPYCVVGAQECDLLTTANIKCMRAPTLFLRLNHQRSGRVGRDADERPDCKIDLDKSPSRRDYKIKIKFSYKCTTECPASLNYHQYTLLLCPPQPPLLPFPKHAAA